LLSQLGGRKLSHFEGKGMEKVVCTNDPIPLKRKSDNGEGGSNLKRRKYGENSGFNKKEVIVIEDD
jgi:hypothetical protein